MRTKQTEEEKLQFYQKKFTQLIASKETLDLLMQEELKHCIDASDPRFYNPTWAVSNMGRCYSLSHNRWLKPDAKDKKSNYWVWTASLPNGKFRPIEAHRLVAHYFKDESDRTAIEVFGKENVEVHHRIPIDIPDELKHGTKENAQARIAHCMEANKKSNLFYQEKNDHDDAHVISRGNQTQAEKDGNAVWSSEANMLRTLFANSGQAQGNSNGSAIIYSKDESGHLQKDVSNIFNMKDSILSRNDIIIDKYRINAGDYKKAHGDNDELYKKFVFDHQDEILEAIKNNPPTSHNWLTENEMDKFIRIDGYYIFYALA